MEWQEERQRECAGSNRLLSMARSQHRSGIPTVRRDSQSLLVQQLYPRRWLDPGDMLSLHGGLNFFAVHAVHTMHALQRQGRAG